MRAASFLFCCIGAILLSSPLRAQDITGDDAVLTPYLSTKTAMIIRFDVTRLNVDAIKDWETSTLKSATTNPHDLADGAKTFGDMHTDMTAWSADFLKSGGKRVYLIFDFNFEDAEPIMIIPVDANSNITALINVMLYGHTTTPPNVIWISTACELIDNKFLLCGDKKAIAAIKKITAAPRPELLRPLAGAGTGAIQAAVATTPDIIQTLTQMLPPELPPELGGGKTADVLAAITTGSASVDLPPKIALNVDIHCPNAEAAMVVQTHIVSLLKIADQQMSPAAAKHAPLPEILHPRIDGTDVKISLDTDTMTKTFGPLFLPSMIKARKDAEAVQSASNGREILGSCLLYAADHNGAFPADLSAAVFGSYAGGDAGLKRILTNPRDPQTYPGYIYLKPSANPTAETVVIYEAKPPEESDEIVVGDGDGHVMTVKKDEFVKQLAATKKAAEH